LENSAPGCVQRPECVGRARSEGKKIDRARQVPELAHPGQEPLFSFQRARAPTFARVVGTSRPSTGCIERLMNRGNPGPCERPLSSAASPPRADARSRAVCPHPNPLRPSRAPQGPTNVGGPQSIVLPHSRAILSPTQPGLAAPLRRVGRVRCGVPLGTPDARRAPHPWKVIAPGGAKKKPLRPSKRPNPCRRKGHLRPAPYL